MSGSEGNRILAGLTPRQREIAWLVAAGLDNPAIAAQLGITRKTVATHLTVIYARTGTGGDQAARGRLAASFWQDRRPPVREDRGKVTLTPAQLDAARLFVARVPPPEAAARLGITKQVLAARMRAVHAKTGTGGDWARERLAAWLAARGLAGSGPAHPATDRAGTGG